MIVTARGRSKVAPEVNTPLPFVWQAPTPVDLLVDHVVTFFSHLYFGICLPARLSGSGTLIESPDTGHLVGLVLVEGVRTPRTVIRTPSGHPLNSTLLKTLTPTYPVGYSRFRHPCLGSNFPDT